MTAAVDDFATFTTPLDGPAPNAVAVTPSDSTDLTDVTRFLYVGVGGDLTVNLLGGEASVLFAAVPAGTTLSIRATRVLQTGTSASQIVAMW